MKSLLTLITTLIMFSAPVFGNDSPEALQEAFMKALKTNDVEGLAACYTADAINFPVDSMMGVGPDSVRESWGAFFAAYTVKEASLVDTHMETAGDIAAAWGIFKLTVVPAEGGDAIEMQGRFMDVAKNVNGHWLYIADHASVPSVSGE